LQPSQIDVSIWHRQKKQKKQGENAMQEKPDLKTALITGAAGGMGQATAKIFAGAKSVEQVFLTDHRSKMRSLDALASELNDMVGYSKFKHFFCDITHNWEIRNSIKLFLGEQPRVDILVNIAGVAPGKMSPLVKTEIESAKKIMEVNFWGTLHWCKAVLPLMQREGYGRIINVSSISAFMADPGNLVYSASKAGIVQLTRSLAKEATFNKNGEPHDITVNAVAPGIIDTDMAKQLSEKMLEGYKRMSPLGRLGKPEEIAKVIYWMATEAPQFLTGEIIRIDGGFLA
jgi:3-oxoacyl-[acyl-carrier protein] reductase